MAQNLHVLLDLEEPLLRLRQAVALFMKFPAMVWAWPPRKKRRGTKSLAMRAKFEGWEISVLGMSLRGGMHPYNECISFAAGRLRPSRGGAQEVVMPIFEYICKGCGNKFEAIVYGSKQSECPACKGTELEQQLSTFAAHGTDKSSGSHPQDALRNAARLLRRRWLRNELTMDPLLAA